MKRKQLVAYIILLFIFQEIFFRLIFPIPEVSNFDRVKYMELMNHFVEADYSRNQTWHWQSSLDTAVVFDHNMNLYGFRDKEWDLQKSAGKKRILFIGDSFVEGLMAADDEQITDYYKQQDIDDEYDVLNAGIAGIGLNVHLQLSADIIPMLKPDIAVLCLYANDMGKNAPIVPSHFLEPEFYDLLTPRIIEIIHQINYHGPLLPRWGGKDRNYFKAIPDSTNPWTFYETLFLNKIESEVGNEMKAGKFNPFLVNNFLMAEKFLSNPALLGETVPFFQYVCKKNRVKPIIVYIPSRNQVTSFYYEFEKKMCFKNTADTLNLTTEVYNQHQKKIAKQCADFKIKFIDLTNLVKSHEDQNNHLFWNYDQHMKAKGYKVLGEGLFKKINP
jgi:lysophospholipase L1-like esterase